MSGNSESVLTKAPSMENAVQDGNEEMVMEMKGTHIHHAMR